MSKKFVERFFFNKEILSEKNGRILIRKRFFRYDVTVGECFQSGPYIDKMFRVMLQTVPPTHGVKRVLLLGLGAGGAVREVKKRFPQAHVTAVEYDPEMLLITNTLYLDREDRQSLTVLLGEASEVIQTIQQKFDLILVDLYVGRHVAPLLSSPSVVDRLSKLLEHDGYLLANFFEEAEMYTPVFDRVFSRWENLKYKINHMVTYRHFGQGKIGDPIPPWYIDKMQSMDYLKTQRGGIDRKETVFAGEIPGVRSHLGPFYYETYVSDTEPVIAPFPYTRLITWQPLTIFGKKGWFRNLIGDRNLQYGIVHVDSDAYWHTWSSHAKRHREKWLKDDHFEIIEADLETFSRAYHATKKLDRFTRSAFLKVLRYHLDRHAHDVHLFAARIKTDHTILAGLAVIDYPDIQQSLHTIAFIHQDARNTSVGVGLIDHWYKHARTHGIVCLNFGIVWKQGDTVAWKGYSVFKRQFAPYLICYPTSLCKIVFGTRF